MKPNNRLTIPIFLFLALATSAFAQEPSPREQFQTAVAAYQKSPTRETAVKIIELYKQLDPPPAVPEEARRPFVMGATVLKKSNDKAGAAKAVEFFTEAVKTAPWFAEAYYNRALAREITGQFAEAMDDLKLYLAFTLSEAERRDAQDKIYSLEADAQLAAAKKSEEGKVAAAKAADTPQVREAALLQKMEGARFVDRQNWPDFTSADIYEIRDQTLILIYSLQSWRGPITKYGYKRPGDYVIARMPYRDGAFTRADSNFTYVYRIRPDGLALTSKSFFTGQPESSASGQEVILKQ